MAERPVNWLGYCSATSVFLGVFDCNAEPEIYAFVYVLLTI